MEVVVNKVSLLSITFILDLFVQAGVSFAVTNDHKELRGISISENGTYYHVSMVVCSKS